MKEVSAMKKQTMGTRIKELRQKSGLTQMQLSEKIFTSESYIALIESNKRNPSMDIICKLADCFNVSSDYLLYGDISEADRLLIKEWTAAVNGRSDEEIQNALKLVRSFFECVDAANKKNKS